MAYIDHDQQWLLNCLNATLDPNLEVRSFAEASLNQASLPPGFGAALSRVSANRELPLGLRQLAAVLLKQFIKKHWHEGEESFEHPAVSVEEKEVIRGLLLSSLDDPHKKICTAISMAIASIAMYDWPENWAELLPFLLKLISNQTNLHGVRGGLRCLALISGDMDDTMVPTLVPALFPCLHTIVSSPQIYDSYLRTKAISIVYSCLYVLGAMTGVYKTETSELMAPLLKQWMVQFAVILEQPVKSEDPDDWSLRTEVIKCMKQVVQNFSSVIESEFSDTIGPLWQTFVTSLRVYVRSSIEGTEDAYEDSYDSDGEEISLDSFVIQLFEFLLTILGSQKLMKVVSNHVKELVYYTIAFLQITEQQIHIWSMDANQFVADEDDVTYSCRVSGVFLLEEVVNSIGGDGINVIVEAVKERFNESQREKSASSAVWWKMMEATLFAVASLSEQLLEAEASGVNVRDLVEQMLTIDIGAGVHEYPFLYARIFVCVAKFSDVISPKTLEHYLSAAVQAVTVDVPPPVKIGACRALSQLLSEPAGRNVQPQMMGLLSALTGLLHQASDETLHLVLETIEEAIKAAHEVSAMVESAISPVILNMWLLHVSDPFISVEIMDVLEAIKNAPGCIHPLVSRILPHVGPILANTQQQPDGLVAGSLDLVTMLLKNAPIDVVKAIYDVCFNAIIQIALQSEDHGEIQNASECLATFISGGRQEILNWASDSGFALRSLLDVTSRLLDPTLESSGSFFVGKYILQLILHLPMQMAQHIRDLIAALVRRLQSAQQAGLRSSLILIFARLVHMSAPKVEQFIDMLISIPANSHDNSLVYVMSEWTKQQGEIQGAYQIMVTTSALALLLCSRHDELWKISVQGQLIKSNAGITTRSKAKLYPDQWTVVLLPAKILSLIADTLIEMQDNVAGDGEESDWEEDAEIDKNLIYSAGSMPNYDELEALAKTFNENEEDNDDGLLLSADPLNKQINLSQFLGYCLKNFSSSNAEQFYHLCQGLTKAQQEAIRRTIECRC